MDLRQLRQFVVLAETGNFHRAAELLHMAQPPLSVSVRKLEEEFGCALFVRHSKGVALTSSGQAALTDARKAIAHAEQVRSVAQAVAQGTGGKLRIGFVGSATYTLLPKLVPLFHRAYPNVDLVFTESTSMEVLRRLDEGTLDVGLVRYPILEVVRRVVLPLERQPFVVAMLATHPLANRKRVSLKVLRDEAFIAHSLQQVPNLHAIFIMMCQGAGFVPRVAQEAIQVQTIVSLVESGLGIALVPASAARFSSKQVRFVPLASQGQSVETGIALVYQEESNAPLVRHFMQIALQGYGRADAPAVPAGAAKGSGVLSKK